jgi:hypothetical protein
VAIDERLHRLDRREARPDALARTETERQVRPGWQRALVLRGGVACGRATTRLGARGCTRW